jgi:DNA-binding GntR family transcriptional regulator
MNRKQRRAWYRDKGMNYREARTAVKEQARVEEAVLKMSPEKARQLLAEWAAGQHSQSDVDAMNRSAPNADERP